MNYSYDANDRLTTDAYDNNGNTASSGGIANTYDFENHMLTPGAVSMIYDGDGNRVSETATGVTTKYLVDTLIRYSITAFLGCSGHAGTRIRSAPARQH